MGMGIWHRDVSMGMGMCHTYQDTEEWGVRMGARTFDHLTRTSQDRWAEGPGCHYLPQSCH